MYAITMELEWQERELVEVQPSVWTNKTWKGLVALQPAGGKAGQGVELEVVPFNGQPEQFWNLTPSGFLEPANQDDDLVAHCHDNGLVTLEPREGGAAQKWKWVEDAYLACPLRLELTPPGNFLTVQGSSGGAGVKREAAVASWQRIAENYRIVWTRALQGTVRKDELAAEVEKKVAYALSLGVGYRQRWSRRSADSGAAA